MKPILMGVLLAFTLFFSETALGRERTVTLLNADVKCISEHLETYMNSQSSPLIIIPGRCPDPTSRLDAETVRATNGPVITSSPKITVLEKHELNCIAKSYARLSDKKKNALALTWNLSKCGKK